MSREAQTPGPWEWVMDSGGEFASLRYRHPDGGGNYVLTPEAVSDDDRVRVETSVDVSPANARLIAAAPAVTAALIGAEAVIDRLLNHAIIRLTGDMEASLIAARDEARAAIHSATGEG